MGRAWVQRAWTAALVALVVMGCDTGPTGSDAGGDRMDAGTDAGMDAGDEACFAGTADSPIGGECNCQADCAEGLVCTSEAVSGSTRGSCSRLCAMGSDECGAEYACQAVAGSEMGFCVQACVEQSDCARAGYHCLFGRCAALCSGDGDCLSGHCNRYDTACDDGSPPMGAGILESCTRGDDCRSGLCETAIGGHCLTPCLPDATTCPDETVCVPGIDSTDPAVGICMPRCSTSADCPGTLSCLNTPQGRVCFRGA